MFAGDLKEQAGLAANGAGCSCAECKSSKDRIDAELQRMRDEREYKELHALLVAMAPTIRKYRTLREKLIGAYPDASIVQPNLNW